MSHFNDNEFKRKREHVEQYYTEHGDSLLYFAKSLMPSPKFRTWIFTEYDRLNFLSDRKKLCEKGHKCQSESCMLYCPFDGGK